ncbi:MAG: CobQ/CobB/MinD/ParA nucleotide binding domain-containing protein [Chloroflexota bacterium]|nr:MAG: CobQ/CobB/MinD/ParA nucleotide binding domain-containing protein [Chloroflexota bacterium]
MSGSAPQIRLLLLEDVPQVAQYIRGLLNAQEHIKLLQVLSDGREAVIQAGQLRPDVIMVDALLQGKLKGSQVIEALRRAALGIPTIVLTVPQNPVEADPERGIQRVLSMPFSGFDFINVVTSAHADALAASPSGQSRVYTLFAPKGGVGRTTLAFNLAVGIAQTGQRTVLVDASFQFGDLRTLLKVPLDSPSILDLPTDRISESDLADVLWRDPSGIDILLAPPRVEMAEMVSLRDVEKVLSLLRRVYNVVVVDTPAALNDLTLAFLDASDLVLEVVTWDSMTLTNTRTMAATFQAIGYPPSKVRYILNRADSAGGLDGATLTQVLGREPEYRTISDGRLVVESNNQGVPFVLANPAAQISQDLARIVADLVGTEQLVGTRR